MAWCRRVVSGARRNAIDRSRGFVQRWCYAYRDHGLDAVGPRKPPGRPPRLSSAQQSAFKQRMIAEEAGEGVHVVLVLDGTGWHKAKDLVVPETMTLFFLPPYAPELMPMERVWRWMRQHDLSNRVFADEAGIDAACKERWNNLTP